jgi:hypothetical protein
MAVAVTAGLALAPYVQGSSPFAAATRMTVGIVMAAAVVRWLAPIAADLGGLDARVLALAIVAAAATWAVGVGGTLLRTTLWLIVATAALLFVAGLVAGAPSTLTDPLVDPSPSATSGVLWLLVLLCFGALHPHPRPGVVGAGLVGLATLAGWVGLLSLAGGALSFPSTGLLTITGFASTSPGTPGAVLALPAVVVAAVASGAVMRGVLTPWAGYPAVYPRLNHPGVRVTVVAVLVGATVFAPADTAVLVIVTTLAGVAGVIFAMRARTPAPTAG